MADAAARREARRRKILENGDDRLKKITSVQRSTEDDGDKRNKENLMMNGEVKRNIIEEEDRKIVTVFKEDTQGKFVEDVRKKSTEKEAKRESPDKDVNRYIEKEAFTLPSSLPSFSRDLSEDQDLLEELNLVNQRFTKPKEPTTPLKQESTAYTTLIILLLGITVRYINLIFDKFEYLVGIDLTFLHIDKIFVPLLIYEIYLYLFGKITYQENPTFNLLLALNNVNGTKLKPILKFINIIMNVLNDVAIYFFAFTILDIIFVVVKV